MILKRVLEMLMLMLSPMAPHIAEELWEMLGHPTQAGATRSGRQYREDLAREEQVEVIIQINGRVRGKILVDDGLGEEETANRALADPRIAVLIAGKEIVKTVVVPQKAGEYRFEVSGRIRWNFKWSRASTSETARRTRARSGRHGEHATRNRGARFRRAIHAADRAAHPRAASVFGDSAVHCVARGNSRAGTGGHRAFRRAELGVRRGRAGVRSESARSWACRCWASATACSGSRTRWAEKWSARERREYGPAQLDIEDGSPLFAGFPNQLKIWKSHGDHVVDVAGGFHVTGRTGQCHCRRRRHAEAILRRAISSRSESHRARHGNPAQFCLRDLRREAELESRAAFIAETVEAIRKQAERRARHLRAERRRGFGGGGGAGASRHRRPADECFRGYRACCARMNFATRSNCCASAWA